MTSGLDELRALAPELGLGAASLTRLDAARRRLTGDVFRVAVTGGRGAGKSLLVNALLGKGVLPCAAAPCTAVPTRVVWGETLMTAVSLRPAGPGGGPPPIPVRELTPHVTRLAPELQARAATLREAVVHAPAPFLHGGAELLDLPGIGAEDSPEAVLSLLEEAHAAVVVMALDAPVSEALAGFVIRLLLADLGWIGLVVAKHDSVPAEERERAVREAGGRLRFAVSSRLGECSGEEREIVLRRLQELQEIGMSSRQALRARITGDAALLAESGVGRLESWLTGLLTGGRTMASQRILASALQACGAEALKKAEEIETAAPQAPREGQVEAHRMGKLLFAGLQGMAREEMVRIDKAAEQAQAAARGLAEGLSGRVAEAVRRAVAAAPLAAADLAGSGCAEAGARLTLRLAPVLAEAVQHTAEEIQMAAQEQHCLALDALHGFAAASDLIAGHVGARLAQAGGPGDSAPFPPSPMTTMTTTLGALWTWDRETAARYAEEGRISDPLLAFGAGLLAAYLAPASVRAVALSPLQEELPARQRVTAFKTAYCMAALAQLEPELAAWQAEGVVRFEAQVAGRFTALKSEIGELLAGSRCRLDELCGAEAPGAGRGSLAARVQEIVSRGAGAAAG